MRRLSGSSFSFFFPNIQAGRDLAALKTARIVHECRDHDALKIQISGGYNVVCGNDMMQAKVTRDEGNVVRGNTGFPGFSETKKQYQARLNYVADMICADIDKNTIAAMRQEFAIQPEDIVIVLNRIKSHQIPGWENPKLVVTEFGVMTCFKSREFENIFHKDESLDKALADLAIRCQVFKPNDSYLIANAHVPYKNTEAAFKQIVQTLLTHKIAGSFDGVKCCDFIGDKNLSPEKQVKLTQKVFEEIRAKREAADEKPITLISYLVSSPNGHQQVKDGVKKLVDVDSCQRFVMFESNAYQFHAVTNNDDGKFKYILSLLIGGGVVTGTALTDEATITEVALMSRSAFFSERASRFAVDISEISGLRCS